MKDIADKIVWITGASSGFGEALALEFADRGAKVILSGRDIEALNRVGTNIPDSRIVAFDMEDTSIFQEKTEEVIAALGRIDIVIHNAGIAQNSQASETLHEVEKRIMRVNYSSPVGLTKYILPHFAERKSGQIVVVSGLLAYLNFPGRSTYAASKAALIGYFGCLRTELESQNIRVSVVIPGSLHTNLVNKALTKNGSIVTNKRATGGYPLKKVAKIVVDNILKGKYQIYVGSLKECIMLKLWGLFPNFIINKILNMGK